MYVFMYVCMYVINFLEVSIYHPSQFFLLTQIHKTVLLKLLSLEKTFSFSKFHFCKATDQVPIVLT